MHIQIPHKSSKITALTRIKQALNEARPKAGDQVEITEERWEGETLHFAVVLQGKNISGTVQVNETHIVVDAKLPLLWRIFEGKIEKMIGEQIKQLG
jgi:hypothetical protein